MALPHASGNARGGSIFDPRSSITLAIPSQASRIIEVMEAAGFEAWCVGGFVRDSLLERAIYDIDIACSAPWQQSERICLAAGMRVHRTGAKHGTITVVCDSIAFEVTTFRVDGTYTDSRHPDSVRFVRSLEEDLARRDFTMNAMAYHPRRGLADPFGGLEDAKRGIIRTVGDPTQRFKEDALRILRACRFSSQLGFSIDPATYSAMVGGKAGLLRISAERITAELEKLLLGDDARNTLMKTVDVLAIVLPELVAMKGFDQRTPYHSYDVLEHTARAVEGTPPYPLARWAALFHDMGKPSSFFQEEDGRGHFYGHAKVSAALACGIMDRLSFSPRFRERVLTLVKQHDDVIEATPRAVKRALTRMGGDVDLFRALCDLKRGDASAQAPTYARERMKRADDLIHILDEILTEGEAFNLKQLAINGRDVMETGIEQGPHVGAALETALNAVIDERVPNDREKLLAFLKEQHANHQADRQ